MATIHLKMVAVVILLMLESVMMNDLQLKSNKMCTFKFSNTDAATNGTKYSRMEQVKFVEDSL